MCTIHKLDSKPFLGKKKKKKKTKDRHQASFAIAEASLHQKRGMRKENRLCVSLIEWLKKKERKKERKKRKKRKRTRKTTIKTVFNYHHRPGEQT